MKTWKLELAVVAAVELVVALASGSPIELLGATAVVLSFAHGQVAARFAEREWATPTDVARGYRIIDCHRWTTRYFVGKEVFWCAYFALRGSWSALVGAGLFIAYPAWRAFYRARRPLAL